MKRAAYRARKPAAKTWLACSLSHACQSHKAERYPNRRYNRDREAEYDDLGIEYETHGLD